MYGGAARRTPEARADTRKSLVVVPQALGLGSGARCVEEKQAGYRGPGPFRSGMGPAC